MIKIVLVATTLAGCATTGIRPDREASTTGSVRLVLSPTAVASRTFPAVVDARLPTADRLARQIRVELGDAASVDVRLCVAVEGHVDAIELTRGTQLAAFDRAVIEDARRWKFEALPGPAGLRTCELATVTYRPRA